jgi:hypothetical protein
LKPKIYRSESEFQAELITELHFLFPGCIVQKQDTQLKQGFPDLLILYKNKWALLECKKSKNAKHQPNQDYYIDIADKMSFARFIYPENKEEVLNDLQQAFRS